MPSALEQEIRKILTEILKKEEEKDTLYSFLCGRPTLNEITSAVKAMIEEARKTSTPLQEPAHDQHSAGGQRRPPQPYLPTT